MSEDSFNEALAKAIEEIKKHEPCMSISVRQKYSVVELFLRTDVSYYAESITNGGFDTVIYRSREDDKVIGCRLPLYNNKLVVWHEGPLRVNEGFLKDQHADEIEWIDGEVS